MGNNCCSEHRRDPSGGFVVRKFSSVFEKAVPREKALDAESETRLRTSSTYSAATTVSVQSDCGRTDATRQVSRGAGDTYRFQRLPPGFNGDSPMRASPTQSRGSPQIYAVRQPRTMMLESTAPSTPSRAVSPPPTPPRAVDSSCDGPGSVSTPDHKRPNLYSAFKKFAKAARHDLSRYKSRPVLNSATRSVGASQNATARYIEATNFTRLHPAHTIKSAHHTELMTAEDSVNPFYQMRWEQQNPVVLADRSCLFEDDEARPGWFERDEAERASVGTNFSRSSISISKPVMRDTWRKSDIYQHKHGAYFVQHVASETDWV